jgi:hypothetical protein
MRRITLLLVIGFAVAVPRVGLAQVPPVSRQATEAQAPLPPATKLEGFKPAAGSVVTLGYDELGEIGPGLRTSGRVAVDARQIQAGTESARGMTVTITESEYREERAFVDEEELPDLIKGVDALLELKANPTSFKNFEVRYTTKGDLGLIAFNNARGELQFAIQAGRLLKARRFLNSADLQKIRAMFAAAASRLGEGRHW